MSHIDSILQSASKLRTNPSLMASSNLKSQTLSIKSDLIHDLYSKFVNLNSQVSIDNDLSAFNMIEYHLKDPKMEKDQQVVTAKLKRLENNAQLKRIEMEIQSRKKKLAKDKQKEYFCLPQKDKYINTYRDLTEHKIEPIFPMDRNNTDSDDGDNGQLQRPKGISFFSQLKKHPKLLQFTVEQAKSRQKLKMEQIDAKHEKSEELKNEVKSIAKSPAFRMNIGKQKQSSPEWVADNIFRRFYTRKSKQQSMDEARRDSRVSSFLDRQQSIMNSVDERSLSKQNYQKLKQKMHSIANELYDDEKKHSKTKLPLITPHRSTYSTISHY